MGFWRRLMIDSSLRRICALLLSPTRMVSPDSTVVPVPALIWLAPRFTKTSPTASRKRPACAWAAAGASRAARKRRVWIRMAGSSEFVTRFQGDQMTPVFVEIDVRAVPGVKVVRAQRDRLREAVGGAQLRAEIVVAPLVAGQRVGFLILASRVRQRAGEAPERRRGEAYRPTQREEVPRQVLAHRIGIVLFPPDDHLALEHRTHGCHEGGAPSCAEAVEVGVPHRLLGIFELCILHEQRARIELIDLAVPLSAHALHVAEALVVDQQLRERSRETVQVTVADD